MATRRTPHATGTKSKPTASTNSTSIRRPEEATAEEAWDLKTPLPSPSEGQQREAFRGLRVPADVYETLWQWGATREQRESVLEFVSRYRFGRGVDRALRQRQRRVYGAAHPSDRSQEDEPGLLGEANEAVRDVVNAIKRLLGVGDKIQELGEWALVDGRIAQARPHLEAALKPLNNPNLVNVDHRLWGRKKGHPAAPRVSLLPGHQPRPVPLTEAERILLGLLRQFASGRPRDVKNLARKLLTSQAPRAQG